MRTEARERDHLRVHIGTLVVAQSTALCSLGAHRAVAQLVVYARAVAARSFRT